MEKVDKDTYVLGLNKENKIIFFKTYNYQIQSDEAQSDLAKLQNGEVIWEIGELERKIQYLLNVKKKFDDLDNEISKFYENEEGEVENNGDLTDIGELAASAFGYL